MALIVAEDYGEKLGEQGRYYLGRLMANVVFIERLIGDLLAYSRVGRKEASPERLQADAVVQNVLGRFSKEIAKKRSVWRFTPLAVALFRFETKRRSNVTASALTALSPSR